MELEGVRTSPSGLTRGPRRMVTVQRQQSIMQDQGFPLIYPGECHLSAKT